jgi:autotransporter-associated beta strand protein
MNKQTTRSNRSVLLRFTKATFMASLLPALVLMFSLQTVRAGSATWNLNPTSGAWNTATNWTPNTVPNGPADIATFGVSNTTSVSLSGSIQVDSIVFNAGASAFTFSCPLGFFSFSGSGVTNNSQTAQNFVATSSVAFAAGQFDFDNSATAGNATFTHRCEAGPCGQSIFSGTSTAGDATFVNQPGASGGGFMTFGTSSTAGNSTLITNGGSDSAQGAGFVQFLTESSAGTSTMITNGATSSAALGGSVEFTTNSTASSATITANGGTVSSASGGKTSFASSSTADQATLIANGGTNGGQGGIISFLEASTGGTARIEIFGSGTGAVTDGTLDITQRFQGVIVGSLEGNGLVLLGANDLTIGSNNLSTAFGGVIQGTGAIIKTGNGKLTFSGANTYSGGTIINAGTLLVTNGRGTGTGPVQINAGKLGGTGRISGNVIVGGGSGPEAFLTPGTTNAIPATLTIQKKLTFLADGTDHFGYKSNNVTADKVVASGVTIGSDALLFFGPIDTGVIPIGTVFTAIDNRAARPIAGTFANIADGATVTVGSNTFQASYEGGDGNDLTLTVVP